MRKGLIFSLLLTSLLLSGCGKKQTIDIPISKEYVNVPILSKDYIEPVDNSTKELLDTSWEIKKAIIVIGDEKLEVEVDYWKDYDNSNIKIKSKEGEIYITDIKNVLLIGE